MKNKLICGNVALAEAAIRAGCRAYFGYPITPQNEVSMYMSWRMEEVGGIFLQAESEIAAINMLFGASAVGKRVMTSSSSPGISLMQETLSYMAGCELPGVIVNIMRGGPGLGNIGPSQSDYFQATRGGGHGDYRTIVLAPSSVQEMTDMIPLAFELSEKYRTPAMVLGDGVLGQMMEPVKLPRFRKLKPPHSWALTGADDRPSRIIRSLFLKQNVLHDHNLKLHKKYERITRREIRHEVLRPEAPVMIVAYGTSARLCKDVLTRLQREGIDAGLFRPVTLWPFPYDALSALPAKLFIAVEMSMGQMIEDVRLSVGNDVEGVFKPGGEFFTVMEITKKIRTILKKRGIA